LAIGTTAAVALAATVIISSRATGQRTDGSLSPKDGPGQVGTLDTTGFTPPPCFPCWEKTTIPENFDFQTPPALPPQWLATNAQGPPPVWGTSNSGVPVPPADTLPNAAFIDDPAVVSDKRLDSFQFELFESAFAFLTFRHNFNLEASSMDPNLGFDGGVLEVSFDNGNTFQDVLEAGGFFIMGGYNRTISTDRGSPIAGRQAWSGNSGGYITTILNIPNNQSQTRLRWRMASDSTGSGEGWRVDTMNVTFCHGEGTPCPTPTPTPTPTSVTPTPTPTPTPDEVCAAELPCGPFFFPPPTDFVVFLSCEDDSCSASSFTVNDVPADGCSGGGDFFVTFHFNTSPVVPGLNTMHLAFGGISCCGLRPAREVGCTFQLITPTPMPRATPTPRPRPTPHARPTPP
jgi:hypothetical protein